MSDIRFSASLDTKKLDDAIKESNKTVGDWAKGVEKSGDQADVGLTKMTKSFKDAIRDQKQLIKEIETDIKKLQKAFEDAAPGRGSQAVGRDLMGAKKALAEEQGTLLGLQKQQIESNTKEAASTEGIIGKLKGWALGLFSVGAALKIGKEIIASTDATTNKFEQVVAGATAGVGYFFKSIASGDWSNFLDGITKAIKGAVEFEKAMDDIENRQNEQTIKSAETSKKIAELRAGTFDKGIENNDKLINNLGQIIELQKTDYINQSKIAKDTYDETLKNAATNSGIAKERLETLVKEYSLNKENIALGEKWKKSFATMREAVDKAKTPEEKDLATNLIKKAQFYSEMATEWGKVPKEARKSLADLKAEQIKLEGLAETGSVFDERQRAAAEKKREKAKEDTKKDAIEATKLENKIAKEKELFTKAFEAGNAEEMKAIGLKIGLLEKELAVRQQLLEAAIGAAIVRETPISKITGLKTLPLLPGGLKIPNILAEAPTKESGDYIKGTAMLTDAGKAKQKEKDAKDDKKAEDSIKRQKELKQEILKGALDLTYQMGQQLGLSEDELNVLGSQLDLIGSLVSGDYVGAAVNVLSQLIEFIPSSAETFAKQIEDINRLIEEQNRLIEASERVGGGEIERQKAITLLEKQRNDQAERLAHIQERGGGVLWTQAKTRKEIEKLTQAVEDSDYAILQANQDLDDFLTGGITQNTLADVIAQGFQEGKTSVDDFGEYMNQVLMDAVLDIFKQQILLPMVNAELMPLVQKSIEGGISKEEAANIAKITAGIAEKNKATWDSMTEGLDFGTSQSNNGLSGGIQRSITEQTGSELAGLFRRFADDNRVTKDYTLAGVNHLIGIEKNTLDTVLRLDTAIVSLQNIEKYTKGVPVGAF